MSVELRAIGEAARYACPHPIALNSFLSKDGAAASNNRPPAQSGTAGANAGTADGVSASHAAAATRHHPAAATSLPLSSALCSICLSPSIWNGFFSVGRSR